jgi:hypothetical protein
MKTFMKDGLDWGNDAVIFLGQMRTALKPVMDEWVEKGYPVHEVAYLMWIGVNFEETMKRITIRAERKKTAWEGEEG